MSPKSARVRAMWKRLVATATRRQPAGTAWIVSAKYALLFGFVLVLVFRVCVRVSLGRVGVGWKGIENARFHTFVFTLPPA